MPTVVEGTEYKTRPKVLMEFFHRSRDQWKEKCLAAKADLKKARNTIAWLQSSRDQWKQKCQQLQAELDQLQSGGKTAGRSQDV